MLLCYSRYDFYTIVDLPEGEHQYKYFVDNEWLCDDKEVCILSCTFFVAKQYQCCLMFIFPTLAILYML